jgi:hypothetical protein
MPRAGSRSSSAALPEAPRQPATQPSITPCSRSLKASRRSNNHRPQPISFADVSRWTSTQPMPRSISWWPLVDSAATRTPHGCFGDGRRRLSDHPCMNEHLTLQQQGRQARQVCAQMLQPDGSIRRHPGGSQLAPRAVFSTIPNPPPELLELRLKLREVLANIGYCMAAGICTDEQVLRHDLSVKFPDEGTDARLDSAGSRPGEHRR